MTLISTGSSTNTTSSTSFLGTSSISTMRPRDILVEVNDARPNCRMYIYFDGVLSNQYVAPYQASGSTSPLSGVLGLRGTPLYTNAHGQCAFNFTIESGRWTNGNKEMIVADTSNLETFNIVGNTSGKASAIFKSVGISYEYQTTKTITTTNTYNDVIVRQLPVVVERTDPLAQSFFTFGDKGGVFVTSIDLFFQSKDESLPVRVELRKMANGFPQELDVDIPNLVTSLNPAQINVSSTALASTRFTFPYPVYLEENKDYCFVVLTNSSKYSLWTSKLGERSKENARIIFDQPYVGSMFKSQNNYTWTSEQNEDIKFTINKAAFNTTVTGVVNMAGKLEARAIYGSSFETTQGSSSIIFRSKEHHGLSPASYIDITSQPNAVYNGIIASNFNGTFLIPSDGIVDDYTVKFNLPASATSSGKINTSNVVYHITIVNSGSGYTTVPSVTVAPPASGTTATAEAIVIDGKVTSINILTSGVGYSSAPEITIDTPISGITATAIAITDALFTVKLNKPVHIISPKLNYFIPESTSLVSSIIGTNSTYGTISSKEFELDKVNYLTQEYLVASEKNENSLMGGNKSTKLSFSMSTDNPNVSPIISISKPNDLIIYNQAINNQSNLEDITSSYATSGVIGYNITFGGSGYTVAPAVTIVPAENEISTTIVSATATCAISGSSVISLTISPGSGYTKPPIIKIALPPTGSVATVASIINPINSELNTIGSGLTRYISQKISLEEVSSGIKLISSIYSNPETTVDWYIRTSLSSSITKHSDNLWQILSCDIKRNKSSKLEEYFDYEFYLNSIEPYDTYDLKAVLSSSSKLKTPIIRNFRVITAM